MAIVATTPTAYSPAMTATPPVASLEKRLSWPALPTMLFLTFLVMLLVLAGVSLWMRPQHPAGLPDDAALLAQSGLPDASLAVLTNGLRFQSAVFGGAPRDAALDAQQLKRVVLTETVLMAWARRNPAEPRVRSALGALALARRDYPTAADRYKEACERSPHYAEGRLGWGLALALDAQRTTDAWQRRALMLRAIAQFAAISSTEPEYAAASWNRAWLLAEAGRRAEAVSLARAYLKMDPTSVWAHRLRAEVLAP
jgi:tetratricopeptide (TPR) repeat protein